MDRTGARKLESLEKTVLSDGTEVWKSDRGEAHVVMPGANVVLATFTGYMTSDFVPLLVGKVDDAIRRGPRVYWFGDYEGLTGFDAAARMGLVDFTKHNRDHFAEVGLLVRSKVAALGISVANLMVGGFLKSYASRDRFEQTVQEAVRRSPPGDGS